VYVTEGSELASRSLKEIQVHRNFGVIILAIRRADGRMIFNPPAEAEIMAGDYLVVMGEPQNLEKLERLLTEVRP
jgi:voltage-gated potassium channel